MLYFKKQVRYYTHGASKTNRDGKTVTIKSLFDHFAANREKYILKTEIIKTFMLDHYFVIGIRKVNAWRILLRSEKIIETQFMKKYSKADFLLCLAPIDWMQIFSVIKSDDRRLS